MGKTLAALSGRYRPGTPFTAVIHIRVSDHEVPADFAIVRINTVIPYHGRRTVSGGRTRYIATLEPVHVHLAHNTIKHFDLVSSVIIENPDSADCQIKLDAAVSGRVWALQEKTNFTFKTDVVMQGQHATSVTAEWASCLDQDTPILLADGSRVPIRQLIRGDLIRNPATSAVMEAAEVIHGTQADEEMYRIGFGSAVISFTKWHPIMTKSGLKPARDIEAGDLVLGEDGAYHPVTVRQAFTGDPKRSVFNLRLTAASEAGVDHLMSAGGFVTGDFSLQNSLQDTADPTVIDMGSSARHLRPLSSVLRQ
jgi:hypothetical protein